MNPLMPAPAPQIDSFDERVKCLTTELELAIQWNRSCILLAVYGSEYVHADAESALENFLIDLDQKIVFFQAEKLQGSLASYLYNFEDPSTAVFFIKGLKQDPIYTSLNQHVDIIKNKNIRIVFWLTQKEVLELAVCAPELWNNRHSAIEFNESPKPEQILQNAIESAWQGTGEYADQFEDTDAKIDFRESLLTGLPKEDESTSSRADLYLKLGILNWRKGDFEKANELLQSALKIAIRLEDNWFEAECFNALALVKSSQNKNDEAVDAYKQAIRLAPQQISAWNNLGNLCIKIMRNDEAMLAFQKALEHNSKDPVAWNGLGNVYFKIGYIDDAIGAFRKAIEYAPTLAQAWNGLGDAYSSTGRDVDAISAYQKAIESNRQFVTPWLRIADIYYRQARHRDAIKAYQRVLHIDPKNSHVWNELGLLYLKINELDESIDAFNKAIELDRGNGWSYANLALAYSNKDMNEKAINLCLRSIELFNDDGDKAVAWDRLASLYRASNDYEKALRAYQNSDLLSGRAVTKPAASQVEVDVDVLISRDVAVQQNTALKNNLFPYPLSREILGEETNTPMWMVQPSEIVHKETANLLEDLLMNTHSYVSTAYPAEMTVPAPVSQAEHSEGRDVMADSKNPAVWNEKGNIHFRDENYDEAIRAYNKAIELDRSFGWPYSNLALTYLAQSKYPEAVLLYQHSITLLEHDVEKAASWNSLGNLYRHMNDYENAVKAYQMADDLDPQNAGRRDQATLAYSESNSQNVQVWTELGNLFFKSGSYTEAMQAYTKAVEIDPDSGWAQSNLAMAYVFQGKLKQAESLYLKSIELFTSDKDKVVSWNRLGNVYRKLNDVDRAAAAYENALKLSNEKPSLLARTRLTLLGNCYTG